MAEAEEVPETLEPPCDTFVGAADTVESPSDGAAVVGMMRTRFPLALTVEVPADAPSG